MKNHITLFCFALLIGISCAKERTIADDLAGEWVYERETFSSSSIFEDSDTRGVMTFNEVETGTWVSDNGFNLGTEIEWDLQRMDTKISITQISSGQFSSFSANQIYEIEQNGDDGFTFSFHFSLINFIVPTDTLTIISEPFEPFTKFETIILTRK
ncbi:MAG: hypothetical protein ACJA1A_003010 [Saprospiraceae bacterium]|jgi:hypothetical protein